MQVSLKNIGMIKEAVVDLNGLTVIAGENDTGKSTLSRLLFSLIKSIDKSDNEEVVRENKKLMIRKQIDEIYFATRANTQSEIDKNKAMHFRNLLNRIVRDRIIKLLDNNLNDKEKKTELDKIKILLLDEILHRSEIEASDDLVVFYDEIFSSISKIIAEKNSMERIFRYKFDKYMDSLFDNEINNKFTNEIGEVLIKEGNTDILKISIEDDEIKDLYLLDELYFNDATFIESPIILQMSEIIYSSRTSLDFNEEGWLSLNRPVVNIHFKDLITKLKQPNITKLDDDSISEIISGNMDYDEKQTCFVFEKGNCSFKTINIASGIKSFGILQMLLKKGFLNERALLILDEPEVNMHPKWQIKYAELLVNIAKNLKIKVLLTSHSPYFIEAIKVFSVKADISQKTNFYFSEKNNKATSSIIYDVSKDLDKIFERLTEPFEDLERESLRDLL